MKKVLVAFLLSLTSAGVVFADSMEPPDGYKPDVPQAVIVPVVPSAVAKHLPQQIWLGDSVQSSLETAFEIASHTIDYKRLQGVMSGVEALGKGEVSSATLAVILYPSRAAFLEYPGKRQEIGRASCRERVSECV